MFSRIDSGASDNVNMMIKSRNEIESNIEDLTPKLTPKRLPDFANTQD